MTTETLSELIELDARYARDPETRWDEFKIQFAKADEATRISMLGYWEQLLDNEVMGPNRKSAELMQKVREVRGLHSELQRVGK